MPSSAIDQYRIPVLEAFPWQEAVLSRNVSSPPSPASKGDRYLIPSVITDMTSLWRGKENQIAWFDGFDWHYDNPLPGWVVYINDVDAHYRWTGTEWVSNLSGSTRGTVSTANHRELYVVASAPGSGDGSRQYPFKTITEALQKIITRGDNISRPYIINIDAGNYNEDIVLENTQYYHIYFKGIGKDLVSVKGMQSAIDNDQLNYLYFSDLTFTDNVHLQGHNNGTYFGTNCVFRNVRFNSDSEILLYNMVNVTFCGETEIHDDFRVANVNRIEFRDNTLIFGQLMEKAFAIRCDLEQKLPASWNGKVIVDFSCALGRFVDWQLHHGGRGEFIIKDGAVLGVKNEPFHIQHNTTYNVINSMLLGNYTYHGDLILNNSFVGGILTKGSGSLDIRNQPASQIYNDSELAGESLSDALNQFQDRLVDLENATGNNILFDATLEMMLIRPKYTIL